MSRILVIAAIVLVGVVIVGSLTIPLIIFGRFRGGELAKATAAQGLSAKAFATAYCPANTAIEGGKVDRKGNPIRTLQDFVAGKAEYVSVAMDKALPYPYGTPISIPELDQKYNSGKPIVFHLVDTGGAFDGKGLTRIDIAVAGDEKSCPYPSDNWDNLNVTLNIGAQVTGTCPNVTQKLLTKRAATTRGTGIPRVIILHYTGDEHNLETEYNYFNNADVDVQYEVFHDGQIAQYEPDNNIAAGALDYNQPTRDYGSGSVSISIENQGNFESSDPKNQATTAQTQANIALVGCLMRKYNITKNNVKIQVSNPNAKEPYNIISHKEADARNNVHGRRSDPGEKFFKAVMGAIK